MDGEHRRGEPCPGHAQAEQNPPQQNGARRVQGHVHHVVSRRMEAPEVVLDPEGGVHERVVLGYRARNEPDLEETRQRPERFVLRDVDVVVPDETRPQHRRIDDEGEQRERQPYEECARTAR